ncbi:complex I assembly factor ACAD9, mitochondrial [Pectinophora gossypiella]|uniref:complex I assembly factor ACAD9, mitochondrial n=1 Tax=Pectinophora gossypiella TaxID=13191 RepID=UPI00214EB944|nr:complex I assembly factor ACAD9, mitochondrial [Pectinophora gossypiella]
MNIARKICTIRNQNLTRPFVRKLRLSASNFESSQATQPQVKEDKFDFEDISILERTERRKAKIPPFMKDVFVSVFNRDMLAYPEVINKEETEQLEYRLSALDKVFSDKEKSRDDRVEALKKTKMYAGPVSLTKGGLAMNATESLRYLEVIASDTQLGQQISDHWVALEALKIGLTSDQYQQIIDDLTSGEKTIGLCIKEKVAERITQADFRTTAEMDGQGIWRISGEKLCYYNEGYLLVLTVTETGRFKALLVHPGAQGITKDGDFVSFIKTPGTPLELASDAQLAQTLGLSRLHAATLSRSNLTKTLHVCGEYVHSKVFCGKPLAELSTIRQAFGLALLDIYASESAEYFTAGLMDAYEEPDTELEAAMCRNFMATHAMPSVLSLLAIPALEWPSVSGTLLDEARHLILRGETLHSVNMFIALNGIHHAGKLMAQEVKQVRNPLFHPTFIIKKVIANRLQEKDAPKLTLYLAEHLHPSLRQPAEQLEYCVLRMKYACDTLMTRHGQDITTAYTELDRLAEAATEILAMTAVLARASRAYCIGLRNAEVEMKLAACFVERTKDKVKKLILEIDDGEYLNFDHFTLQFGKKILDTNTTLVEKPTARVYW